MISNPEDIEVNFKDTGVKEVKISPSNKKYMSLIFTCDISNWRTEERFDAPLLKNEIFFFLIMDKYVHRYF